jgi:hypothetical protein
MLETVPEVHLLDRLAVVFKHLRLITAVFAVVVSIAMLESYSQTPLYRAQARIVIQDERSTAVGAFSVIEPRASRPPSTLDALIAIEARRTEVPGRIPSVASRVVEPVVPRIMASTANATAPVDTVNVPLAAPPSIETDDGTVAAGSLLDRVTTTPASRAGALRVTVANVLSRANTV